LRARYGVSENPWPTDFATRRSRDPDKKLQLRRPGARLLESLEFGGFVGDRAALPKIPFRIDLCKWLDLFVCAMRGSAAHKQMFLGA